MPLVCKTPAARYMLCSFTAYPPKNNGHAKLKEMIPKANFDNDPSFTVAAYLSKGAQFRMFVIKLTNPGGTSNAFPPYRLHWKVEDVNEAGTNYRALSLDIENPTSQDKSETWNIQSYVTEPAGGTTIFCMLDELNVTINSVS